MPLVSWRFDFYFVFSTGAASYNVYVYQVTNEELELAFTDSTSSLTYTVQSLRHGLEYRTRIRSVGVDGQESDGSVQAITATS